MSFLQYHEPLEDKSCDVFTFRFLVASNGNFLKMRWSGTVVVGRKGGAKLEMKRPCFGGKKTSLFSMSWIGKAGGYISWELAASTEESEGTFFMEQRFDWHHPPLGPQLVGETKKSHWVFSVLFQCLSRIQTEHIQIQLLVCLWSSST